MKIKLITILFTTLLIVDCATAQEYTIEEIQLSGNVQGAYPSSINNNGVVVGRCYIPSYGYYGFIYEKGIFNLIVFSGSTNYSLDFSINDLNNFTGTGYFPNPMTKGFFNYQFLSSLGDGNSWGSDINNNNLIVGSSSSQTVAYMVIYQGTSIINAYQFDGAPEAINDSGLIVANDYPGLGYGIPCIYNYNTSQLTYLPDISAEIKKLKDINNLNQIVGYYEHSDSLRQVLFGTAAAILSYQIKVFPVQ